MSLMSSLTEEFFHNRAAILNMKEESLSALMLLREYDEMYTESNNQALKKI